MNEISVVTLDGPSGVGKSTVSRRVAAAIGFVYLDTGAMYRAAGLYLQDRNTAFTDEEAVRVTLAGIDIRFVSNQSHDGDVGVLLNGRDVSERIRTPESAMLASTVSAIPAVREILTLKQQEYGTQGRIVAEGRDTGTVVFPNAAFKYYLVAEAEERARRRVAQYQLQGKEVDFNETLAMIQERDKNDSEREVSPLRMAEDAMRIDTTSLTLDEVVSQILEDIEKKKSQLRT